MKRNLILLIRIAKEIENEVEGVKKLLLEYQQMPKKRTGYLSPAKASIFHLIYYQISMCNLWNRRVVPLGAG